MKDRIIYKYRLPVEEGDFTLDLPVQAQVLHLGVQDGEPYIWVALKEGATEKFYLHARWTGRAYDLAQEGKFLATLVLENYGLVVHYFLATPTPAPSVPANS